MSAIETPIGELVIENVFMYYDGPRLFSCRNSLEQTYIALWVDTTEKGERWFYLPVSPKRVIDISQGSISLRNAFINPEEGWLWDVCLDFHNPSLSTVQYVLGKSLAEEDLPDSEVYLKSDYYTDNAYSFVKETNVGKEYRECIDITLETGSTEINMKTLGNFLSRMQDLLKHLAEQGMDNKQLNSGSYTMNVTGTYNGSFGIHLGSAQSDDLFGDNSIVKKSIQLTFKLLSAEDNIDQLRSIFKEISLKAYHAYKGTLKALDSGRLGAKISWKSSQEKQIVQLPLSKIKSIIKILSPVRVREETRIDLVGELIAIDMKKKSFKLISENKLEYLGAIDLPPEVIFELPQKVKVVLTAKWELNPVTNMENPVYTMVEIERYNSDGRG